MKKIVICAALFAAATSLLSALDFAVGARAAFGLGVGTDVKMDDTDLNLGKTMDVDGLVFGKLWFTENIILQAELGTTAHKVGMTTKGDELSTSGSDSRDASGYLTFDTLDVPLLVGYDIPLGDSFSLTPFFGPQVSFVLGKAESGGDFSGTFKPKSPVLFDVVFGASAAYNLGPGAIVGDVRYNLGLIPLTVKDSGDDLFTPRALLFGLGYQLKFEK